MPNPIGHVEVLGADASLLRTFYGSVFDWQVAPSGEDDPEDLDYAMVYPEGDRTGVSGGIGRRLPEMHAVTFYVKVDDLQGTLDAVERHGGRTVTPPLRIGPETAIARFADPDGNVIGLVEG